MERPEVAVVIPAYNEAGGIAGFLQEIDQALVSHAKSVRLVVVDDASTDGTREALDAVAPELEGTLSVFTNKENQGHGPTLMRGYRYALEAEPDFVLQVDGDGQFHGSDLRRVLVLLLDQAHAVCGVRRFRQDPWVRMILTRLVRRYLAAGFAVHARDANCPLRGYEAELLADLMAALPLDCLVPNLYLTIIASRRGVPLLEVDVSHRVRRGGAALGSTWGGGSGPAISWRLVRFAVRALRESMNFRAHVDAPAPERSD
jgi:glycosyltransferase involved in cell wall biosynthesis